MKLGRYQDSPTSYSFLQSSNKIAPRSQHSSMAKNPQQTGDESVMKLPSLPGMRKSISFTTERNTRNQLLKISEKLEQMHSEIHNTRMDANGILNQMKFVKQELVDNTLTKNEEDLKLQINGLKRLVHFTKQNHENRSNELREQYIRLWNQTEDIRQLVFNLKIKIDSIEDTMGSRNL